MNDNISISQLFAQPITDAIIKSLWYDWFCKEKSLINRGKPLISRLKGLLNSEKFDNDKCYVFFKNSCPMHGGLFDQFSICDIETGDVIYCILPRGFANCGKPEIWGKENDFSDPILTANNWREVKAWFMA